MGGNPHHMDTWHQQWFMEDWQEVHWQQGNHYAPQHHAQGMPYDICTGANKGAAHNGWPSRPVQTTLDEFGYLVNAQPNENQQQQHRIDDPIPNCPWGDCDPNKQGPGPTPQAALSGRSPTPHDYAWTPTNRDDMKILSDLAAKPQQIANGPTRPLGKP